MTRHKAKNKLKRLGWTQRAAAEACGVTCEHLNRVLNGQRESARLIRKVGQLPRRTNQEGAAR